ncbi:DNA primase, partial [Mannheimia haemolytica]
MFRLNLDTHILNGKLSLFRVNCQIKSDLLQ